MSKQLEEKLKLASRLYQSGNDCVESILSAYCEFLPDNNEEFKELKHCLKKTIGSDEFPCAGIGAAAAILEAIKTDTDDSSALQNIIETIIRREYGSTTCEGILKGKYSNCQCCEMHIKNIVLISESLNE